jgi:hypothetical protein
MVEAKRYCCWFNSLEAVLWSVTDQGLEGIGSEQGSSAGVTSFDVAAVCVELKDWFGVYAARSGSKLP